MVLSLREVGKLERITITGNHFMVPGDRVNPLYINGIEQRRSSPSLAQALARAGAAR